MTALDQYTRLEAIGHWRETPGAEPREVLIQLGEARLTLTTLEDVPLAHWSLAALEEWKDGADTVLSPDIDHAETLRLTDRDMLEALRTIRAAHMPQTQDRPRGSVRAWLAGGFVLLCLGVILAQRPLTHMALDLVPEQTWSVISRDMVTAHLAAHSGTICRGMDRAGPALRSHPILQQIAARLPQGPGVIRPVLARFEGPAVLMTSGALVLINANAVELAHQPEEIAGLLALARATRALGTVRTDLADVIGPLGVVDLLRTGRIPQHVLSTPPRRAERSQRDIDTMALDLLSRANLPSLPLTLILERDGVPSDRLERLQLGDTIGQVAYTSVLDDQSWVALQVDCPL